jgi:glycosyltransferase involved in cell wall biosynthesis
LPSRFESFGIAALEAAVNGDYLIMSDVGGGQDLIPDERYGHILQDSTEGSQNEVSMAQDCIATLNSIINGKIDTNHCMQERIAYYTENFTMENIVRKDCFKQWIG